MAQILELTYNKQRYDDDQQRIEDQTRLYNYYVGAQDEIISYLENALEETYDPETIEEMQLYFINIAEKLINQLCTVYHKPAEYTVMVNGAGDEALTEYYNGIVSERQNTVKKLAHRYAKLMNVSLTMIRYDKKTGKIKFSCDPSWLYQIEQSELDKNDASKIAYLKYSKAGGKDELFTVVWTEDEHYKIDSSDAKIAVGDNSEMINPYGIIPFAVLRMRNGLDFWGEGMHDVAVISEMINFLLTILVNDNIILGTSGTTLAVNLDLKKKGFEENGVRKVRTGKRHPIVVETQPGSDQIEPRLEYVTSDPHITEVKDTIDWAIKMIALAKGLNPNSFLGEVQATSGYSKIVDSLEQLEIRQDDLEACREYEHHCFEILKRVNNVEFENVGGKLKKIPDEAYLKVDFAEVEIPKSPDEEQSDIEFRIKHNLTNYAKVLIDENPDLTEDEALEEIRNNKKINGEFSEQNNSLVNSIFKKRADAQLTPGGANVN